MRIESKDISVVVQGPVNFRSFKCLKSIKKYFPDSEIILSTWEETDKYDLEDLKPYYNKLILNKDPGAVLASKIMGCYNNLNRMLLSTKSGLKEATRKYIFKIRSDMEVIKPEFLKHFDDNLKRIDKYKLFSHRILAYPVWTIKYFNENGQYMMAPYNISDFAFFGYREDCIEFWNAELVKEPEYTNYLINHPYTGEHHSTDPYRKWQYPPEQYIPYTCAKRNFPEIENYPSWYEWNDKVIEDSEIFIVNNFKVLTIKEWGIIYTKFNPREVIETFPFEWGLYTYYWYQDYKKYCDNSYKLTFKQKIYTAGTKKHNFYIAYYQRLRKAKMKQLSLIRNIIYFIGAYYFLYQAIKKALKNI